MAASSAARNRVPIQAPAAPAASTAASPAPSATPPAATTGVGSTAPTTARTSGRVATSPRTWPPASQPWATITSAPAATAALASAALAAVCRTAAPAACARSMSGAGSPQKNDTTGAPSSRHQPSRSSCGKASTRLTPKERLVRAFVSRICSRSWASGLHDSASMPSPPALLTAAANAGDVAPPIGAWTIGAVRPKRSVRAVRNTGSGRVGVGRGALLQVGQHRLDLVGRADQPALLDRLLGEPALHVRLHRLVEQALGGPDRVRVLAGDLAGRLQRLGARVGRDASGESVPESVLAREDASGVGQLAHQVFAGEVAHQLSAG